MTLIGSALGMLGVVIFARWLLIGGDDSPVKKR